MAGITELLGLTGNTTTQVNAPAQLNNRMEKFANNPGIANQFKVLSSGRNSTLDDVRNNIVNAYNVFEESTNPAFRQYIGTSLSQGKQLLADIDKQKSGVESYYGPGGTAEKMIDEYVTKYGNLIAQQSAGSQALAKNVGIRSGASESAIRAGVSAQQALDADKIIKFQEKKVSDLTNLYNTYNTLISQLRSESSTANQSYILQPLAQILDRQTQIASALVNNEAQLNQLRLSGYGTSSTTNTTTPSNQDILNAVFKQNAETMKTNPGQGLINMMSQLLGMGQQTNTNTTTPTSMSGSIIQ